MADDLADVFADVADAADVADVFLDAGARVIPMEDDGATDVGGVDDDAEDDVLLTFADVC